MGGGSSCEGLGGACTPTKPHSKNEIDHCATANKKREHMIKDRRTERLDKN